MIQKFLLVGPIRRLTHGAIAIAMALLACGAAVGQGERAFEVVRAEDTEVDLSMALDQELSPGDRLVVER